MSITENIAHPLVSSFGWALFHSLWQFLLIAMLCRLALMFTSKSKANTRYIISLLALLAMPLTFGITYARQYAIYADARQIINLEFADASIYTTYGDTNLFVIDKTIPAFIETVDPYTSHVFWLYLAGLLLFSTHGVVSYCRVRILRFKHTESISTNWREKINQLCHRAGLAEGKIHILHSTKVLVPAVIGLIKPLILLPIGMFTALDSGQIETIILHEMRHIRNKDHYVNALQTLLEILLFYHPAMWWISRQLRSEREKRVDEWVVGHTGSRIEYAQALFTLENNRSGVLQPALAATHSKNLLLTRIKNIMTMKTKRMNYGRSLAALSLTLAALVSLAWYDPATSISKFGVSEPVYFSSFTNQPVPAQTLQAMAHEEEATDTPPVYLASNNPKNMYLHDGTVISWESLSEKDRAEIRKALAETRLALAEVNKEMQDTFNSEEFSRQMREASEEMRKAVEEANREISNFNSEEFREEMRQVREEVRKALEEAKVEVNAQINSEEFREEMRRAGEEVKIAMEELRKVDWEGIGIEVNRAMQEVGKTLEELGPIVNDVIKEIKIDEILQEVFEALEKATAPADSNKRAQDPPQRED